jgi:hypothetical protein
MSAVKFYYIAAPADSQIGTVNAHIPGDDQVTTLFPERAIVDLFVENLPVHSPNVFCPLLFNVDQSPLTAAEGEML